MGRLPKAIAVFIIDSELLLLRPEWKTRYKIAAKIRKVEFKGLYGACVIEVLIKYDLMYYL